MKAVIYQGKNEVAVNEIDPPKINDSRDAVVRITSAAICGSDLHMYDGRSGIDPGCVFGHEIMGVIDSVGDAVASIKKGDRVVLPFNIACGVCFNCVRGFTNACLTMNPKKAGAAYGYAGMGPYNGGQAEYVLVPRADFNCLKVPGKPGDDLEEDFLLLSDIFPTGYHGAVLAHVEPGTSVAIYGAGPVGLMAALSSHIRGAAEVYVVDRAPERLRIAEKMGSIPININNGDPAQQIKDIRKKNSALMGRLRPGEEKLDGVMCGIDAVGYQAFDVSDPSKENPMSVLDQLAEVVNATGHIGIVGVYPEQDPGGVDAEAKQGTYLLPFGKIWDKGITLGMGQCPVKNYDAYLRDLIIAGKAKPSQIISHRLPLSDAPDAYQKFDKRGLEEGSGYTKVVLKPHMDGEEK